MIRKRTTTDGLKQEALLPSINENKGRQSSIDEDDDASVVVNLEGIDQVTLSKEAEMGENLTSEKPKRKKKVIDQDTEDSKQVDSPIDKLYEGRVPYEGQNFFKKVFFSWATDYVDYARNNKMHLNQLGDLAKGDQVEEAFIRLKKSWKVQKKKGGKNALFKAIILAYKKEYLIALLINIFTTMLNLSSPYLIKHIIDFINADDQRPVTDGLFYVALLVTSQSMYYIITEHQDFWQRMIGVKSTNAMISLIYQKQLKISSSGNKKFSQGEIVNFIQVDAQKMQMISENLAYMAKYPIVFTICFLLLSMYIGATFLAGLGVFFIAFVINTFISNWQARMQKVYMKKTDARVSATTECFNNIKMLKLYSWIEPFEQAINEKRDVELNLQWKRLILYCVNSTLMYFFPQILSAVVFSVYIGTGHSLDISTAYTVMAIFNNLKEPLRMLPQFIGQMIELLISMRRIQEFLGSEIINQSMISTVDFEQASDAITISNGNFFWGLKEQKEEETKKKGNMGELKKPIKEKMKGQKQTSRKKDIDESFSIDNSQLLADDPVDVQEEETIDNSTIENIMALRDINLNIKQGEFVCIIGDVGSGKSSLLNAMIGDLQYLDPSFLSEYKDQKLSEDDVIEKIKIQTKKLIMPSDAPIVIADTVAYVQQNPWIQNKTIRDNILFGLPYEEEKYKETVKICQLRRDLNILPAGDMTEIGEKGINLSGGQKARVSLARAVYSDSNIMLMDDPISALDSNVKKKIFKNVFLDKFSSKTRILVTHAVDFLHLVDTIILLQKGKIVLKGNYNELKDSPYLKEVIGIHKFNKTTEEEVKLPQTSLNPDQNDQNAETDISPMKELINLDDLESSIDSLNESSLSSRDDENTEDEEQNNNDLIKQINIASSNVSREKSKKERQRSMNISDSIKSEQSSHKNGKMMSDENQEDSRVGIESYKQLLKYLGGWKFIVMSQLSMLGFICFKILSDYQVGNWATSPDQSQRFAYYSGLTFAYAIMNSLFTFLRNAVLVLTGWSAAKIIHQQMLNRVINAPINLYFDITPIGRILNRFSKDLSIMDTQFFWYISGFLVCFYQLFSILLVATIVVPWILVLLPFLSYLVIRLYNRSIQAFRETSRIESMTKSPLLSFMGETFNGKSTIRAFKKQKDFINDNNEQLNYNIKANRWSNSVQAWFSLRIDLISITILSFSTFFCVLTKDAENQVFFALLLTYILLLNDFILWTVKCFTSVEKMMVNIDRCLKMLDVPQESMKGTEEQKLFFVHRDQWPEEGKIVFDKVNLRYRPNTEIILRDLSFEVKPREKIGVVGRTGAGKSTICLSLSRIVEIASGSINIDGVNITELPLNELRRRITVIPQDPTMFTGTLRFNLDPEGIVEDERIIELLKEAQLEDLLLKDPKGLQQDIAENGSNLSSGEKQLICICRAILRKSRIVILDEATANIDVITEQQIQNLIETEFKDSTMITIAHRLNTIIKSDRVLVLSYGEILEYDTPQNLMNNPDSEFYQLLQDLKKEEQSSSQTIN